MVPKIGDADVIQGEQKPKEHESLERHKCTIYPITYNGEIDDYAIRVGEQTRTAADQLQERSSGSKNKEVFGQEVRVSGLAHGTDPSMAKPTNY